jgi:hypothetical protein
LEEVEKKLQPLKKKHAGLDKELKLIWKDLLKYLFSPIEKHCTKINKTSSVEKKANLQLQWLYWMQSRLLKLKRLNSEVVHLKVKKFALFPVTGFIPTHMPIDENAMRVFSKDDQLKDVFRNKPANFWEKKGVKCTRVTTDGVSITFTRQKQEIDPTIKRTCIPKIGRYVDDCKMDVMNDVDGVITIDLNRRNFGMIVYTPKQDVLHAQLQKPILHKKLSISVKTWRRLRGIDISRRRLQRIEKEGEYFQQHKKDLLGVKFVSADDFHTSMSKLDPHLKSFLELYKARSLRKAKMESYSLKQNLFKRLKEYIFEKLEVVPERTLIVLGDGGFAHNSKGHDAMPQGSVLFSAWEKVGLKICYIDEFRTSKCCSLCGNHEMKPAKIVQGIKGKPIVVLEETGEMKRYPMNTCRINERPWGLKVCDVAHHDICKSPSLMVSSLKKPSILSRSYVVWDRDLNACLNMVRLVGDHFQSLNSGVRRMFHLSRHTILDTDDLKEIAPIDLIKNKTKHVT